MVTCTIYYTGTVCFDLEHVIDPRVFWMMSLVIGKPGNTAHRRKCSSMHFFMLE